MTVDVPDYVIQTPSTQAVHTEPPTSYHWQQLTNDQQKALRKNLIESILQEVVTAVISILLPGPAGAQLAQWAENLASQLAELPGINLVVTVLENGFQELIDLVTGGVGNAPAQLASFITGIASSIVAGITGILNPGAQPDDVNTATSGQTDVVRALAAKVNELTAQLAAVHGSNTAADDFHRSNSVSLGASWSERYVGGGFFPGHAYTDGEQAAWIINGASSEVAIFRWVGANRLAVGDTTETAIVLGTPLGSTVGFNYVVIIDRLNDTSTTGVGALIGYTGAGYVVQLIAYVNDVLTVIGSVDITQPPVGAICKLICGTTAPRNFRISINDANYDFTDGSAITSVGSGFRGRGFGYYMGALPFIGQFQPGAVAHWTAVDVANTTGAPPAAFNAVGSLTATVGKTKEAIAAALSGSGALTATAVIGGGSGGAAAPAFAGVGALTASVIVGGTDTYFGGTPSTVSGDTYFGGTPSATSGDTYSGGTP